MLGSNLHSIFNDNNGEAKLLAFQLDTLNSRLSLIMRTPLAL